MRSRTTVPACTLALEAGGGWPRRVQSAYSRASLITFDHRAFSAFDMPPVAGGVDPVVTCHGETERLLALDQFGVPSTRHAAPC